MVARRDVNQRCDSLRVPTSATTVLRQATDPARQLGEPPPLRQYLRVRHDSPQLRPAKDPHMGPRQRHVQRPAALAGTTR